MGISVIAPSVPALSDQLPIDIGPAASAGGAALAARQDHIHRGLTSSTLPSDAGIASAAIGVALLAARADHVHKLEDTGWIAPTLLNGWVNYGSNWATAGYRRIGPIVVLRGLIRNGTLNTTGFTVPVGFRVGANLERHFPTISNGALGGVRVYSNGDVRIGAEGSNLWFSLDGVYWVAEA